jgi:glycosyltransferase involved in cell wall biosynthesis
MEKRNLRVAMIAPPWLPIPPKGYGGVENVLYALVPALKKLGAEVELFTIGDSKLRGVTKHWVYKTSQYEHIHKPYYDTFPIYIAHMLRALEIIRKDGRFDIIHDHNSGIGPLIFSQNDTTLPPVVHTIHNPPFTTPYHLEVGVPDNRPMWNQIAAAKRLHIITISQAMERDAPKELLPIMLSPVHNAVNVEEFPFVEKKKDYFITLARFHPEKGQHIAVRACKKLGFKLKMAGNVGDITTKRKLLLELGNPLSPYRGLTDFRYYSDQIFPYLLENHFLEHVGEVGGKQKMQFISQAKALLFPIQWEEVFGMAPIEALACGTPVVAMARGALPEIIQHGVNGFLAHNEKEFEYYMQRVGEIDPAACRKSVVDNFSAELMASRYLAHYNTAIARANK